MHFSDAEMTIIAAVLTLILGLIGCYLAQRDIERLERGEGRDGEHL